VHGGWVTLKGDVSFQFESDAAYDDVSSLYGVVGVTNEIRVTNP
jgi:osmotically-inducible protein OsmY